MEFRDKVDTFLRVQVDDIDALLLELRQGGVEVGHANLELTPDEWRAARTIPVRVEGVTPELLWLLGA